MTVHPNVASLEADIVSFTSALEELETEIVAERAKALDAQKEAEALRWEVGGLREDMKTADETIADLREQLREAQAEIEEQRIEADRLQKEADDMEKDRDAAQEREGESLHNAQEALADWLVENGHSPRASFYADRYLQRLVDAIL